MKKIVIFREQILGTSETFILKQIQFIKKYYAHLVGLTNANKLDLSTINHTSVDEYSKAQVLLYKAFGICPTLSKIFKSIQPSLIHIHMGEDAARFLNFRKKINIPTIVTFHGVDAVTSDEWKMKRRNLYNWYYVLNKKKVIRTFDCFIAVSNFVKQNMIRQGFPENKIKVLYTGIDTKTFCSNEDIKREPIVLFIGRLTEQKGCDYLIKAMRIVNQEIPNAKLYIIGDGPERLSLEELSSDIKVNCTFLGAQKEVKVKEMLSRAQVFCCPSFSEGLGMVFLEAQAMGVPVVSFDSGGIPEAVITNKTGLLYPEKDILGIAQGIIKFLTDSKSWEEYSRNGIEHVKKNFDIEKQSILLENIYSEVLNNKGGL